MADKIPATPEWWKAAGTASAGLEEDEVVQMILGVISDEDFQLDMNAVYPDGREGGGSVIGWQIALALGPDGVPIARGIEAYSHLGSGASILVLGKNAADGYLLAPAATMAGRSIPPAFLRAVALYNESLSAGLEEKAAMGPEQLLELKAQVPEADSTVAGLGVIAGPHANGLAYGAALTRVRAGLVAAVVYVWQEQREFAFPPIHLAVVILGVGVLSPGLCWFRRGPSRIQPPEPLAGALRFIGRRTLEIYAIQLAGFELIIKLVPDLAP